MAPAGLIGAPNVGAADVHDDRLRFLATDADMRVGQAA